MNKLKWLLGTMVLLTITSTAQVTAPIIAPDDQQKLTAAWQNLHEAQVQFEIAKANAFANAGCAPKLYDLGLDKSTFQCVAKKDDTNATKKPVASVTPKPAGN